jgi:hypothetical protein
VVLVAAGLLLANQFGLIRLWGPDTTNLGNAGVLDVSSGDAKPGADSAKPAEPAPRPAGAKPGQITVEPGTPPTRRIGGTPAPSSTPTPR